MSGLRPSVLPLVGACWVLLVSSALAQRPVQDVPARVNGESVTRLEVERVLREAFRDRPLAEEAKAQAEAAALDQAINRRLVLNWLQSQRLAATPDEIQEAYDEFVRSLEFQQVTLADYLEREKLTEDLLRRAISWDIAWGRYIRQQLTIPAREAYFEEHRRQFDGTRLRVSHILLGDTETDLQARQAQSVDIHRRLTAGEITFEVAVSEFSTGTKENGGDLGFIERRGSMPEPFSSAAFDLEVGEISDPVVTPFGVHIIQVTEIEEGKKELKDVVTAVDQAMTRNVLADLVKKLRAEAKLEFTGGMPYFDPETGELVQSGG